MTKVDLYTATGTRKGSFDLPKIYSEKVKLSLLSQAIRVYEDRIHPGLAKVKTRSEVALSTRKIYRQKGTGGARHGAKSAPIFVGGGVAHGPKGIKRQLLLPKKMRKKALNIALSFKAKNGDIKVVESLSKFIKTKDANDLIKNIVDGKKMHLTVVIENQDKMSRLAFKNIKNTSVVSYSNLNPYNVFYGGIILIDKKIFVKDNKRTTKSVEVKAGKKKGK